MNREKEIRDKISVVVGEKNTETFIKMTKDLLWNYNPEFLATLYKDLILDLGEQVAKEKARSAFEGHLSDIIRDYANDTIDDERFACFKNADWDRMARMIREDIDSFVRRAQLVGNCNSLLDEIEDLKSDAIFGWDIR